MIQARMEILFGLGFVAILILAYLSYQYARKKAQERQTTLLAIAKKYGLDFNAGQSFAPEPAFTAGALAIAIDPQGARARFGDIDPFGKGHSQSCANIIGGAYHGSGVLIFDYTYKITTSNGKSTTTTTYNVQIVSRTVACFLPHFTMQPENFLLKIGEKLGYHEIEFESEEFNKRWFVRGADARSIYDLLHPRAMERLLKTAAHTWSFLGNQIVVIAARHLTPDEIERLLIDTDDFIALIPAYFSKDHSI